MTKLLGLAAFLCSVSLASSFPFGDQCGELGCTGPNCGTGPDCFPRDDWSWNCAPEHGNDGTTITTSNAAKAWITTPNAPLVPRSKIPAGAITIKKNGGAQYTSISEALKDTSSNIYYVYAGNYTEAVYIDRPNVQIHGETDHHNTWAYNVVTISRSMTASIAGGNDASATVRISTTATNVRLYHLNIENTYGYPNGYSQALALSALGDRFGAYGCQLRGYQDTLLANYGLQAYGLCLIQGAVDFIFGQRASVWITRSVIKTVGDGFITASGRDSDDDGWFVIDRTKVTGTGKAYLGRPWRPHARVMFQYCTLDDNVVQQGWSIWTGDDPRTNDVFFGEHSNNGPRVWCDSRASFAQNLTQPVSINTVLGSDLNWLDGNYL